jgi:hypothetical protein
MTIDFLYWADCPSHAEALERLRSVLADEAITVQPRIVEVETQAQAEALRFPGSPTIHIDGADIDPAGVTGDYALTCRVYTRADGRITPLPPRELIVAAVRRAYATAGTP